MSEEVLLQRDAPISGVCTITLNRPSRGNALTSVMLDLLLGYLKALEDDVGVFAVVLTGSGKFFCTGMDLSGNGGAGIGKAPENVFSALARFAKPLFARVNGPCLGGGVGILFCCDIR
jgi:methylglutaconyl-CoA hydratase